MYGLCLRYSPQYYHLSLYVPYLCTFVLDEISLSEAGVCVRSSNRFSGTVHAQCMKAASCDRGRSCSVSIPYLPWRRIREKQLNSCDVLPCFLYELFFHVFVSYLDRQAGGTCGWNMSYPGSHICLSLTPHSHIENNKNFSQ